MINEARMAMMLARVKSAPASLDDEPGEVMTARQALEMATLGGAAVLGREDIGSLEAGKCADFIAINLDRLEYAGALHDPVAAAIFCSPLEVDFNYVHGQAVVADGQLVGVELPSLVEKHNAAARRLVRGE